MKFIDIPKLTKSASYRVHQSWKHIEEALKRYTLERNTARLDLNPEFQRGHVWTTEQQRAYVEFKLKSGEGSELLFFNCIGWMNDFRGPFVLVDGKQRLEAVRKFLRNELTIFNGYYRKDFEDDIGSMEPYFIFCVNDLPNMQLVLQWYLELNEGGTPHTKEELDKVRRMITDVDTMKSILRKKIIKGEKK